MPASIKKSRLNAFINQAGLCYYCKSAMWLKDVEVFATKHSISTSDAARFQCTAEHLAARSHGAGSDQNRLCAGGDVGFDDSSTAGLAATGFLRSRRL